MKLLLAFNIAALAFVLVTNSGYVEEIVEGQDPYCEYGIIAGNLVLGVRAWRLWRYDRQCFATRLRIERESYDWMQSLFAEREKTIAKMKAVGYHEPEQTLQRK